MTKSAMFQHSQLGCAMTIIKGFPQVPPELRAGQGAGKNAVVLNGRLWRRKGWQELEQKLIAKQERMCCGRKQIQRSMGVSGVMLTHKSSCVSQDNVLGWTMKALPTQSSPLLC